MRPLKTHFPDNALPGLRDRTDADQGGGCLSPCPCSLSWRFSPEEGPNIEKLLYGATCGENPSGEAFSPSPQG